MSVTSELIDRLRRHYIKEPQPGGIFIAECGLNNSFGAQRRVDAVHIGFTRTSGQILRGHEVKVSRADWLHELEQPEKAAVWSDACHEWWLVTPVPELVALGELPPGWGHMVPDPRAKTRFRVLVQAERKPADHTPSWLVMRSLIARLDTLNRNDRHAERQAITAEIREKVAAEHERREQAALTFEQQQKLTAYDELVGHLGLDPAEWRTQHDLLAAARLAPRLSALLSGNRFTDGPGMGVVADDLAKLADTLREAHQELTAITQGKRVAA